MNKLRDYQETCVNKMGWSMLFPQTNDLVSVPTGGGKTHIIAEFVERIKKPVLILVPSKELLEQDFAKLKAVVPETDIGIFSASMNSKEVKKYTLATIQSAHRHPELFAHYDLVLIDEADLLNPKNLQGMYNKFFRMIGFPKVIGLSATCFRMDSYYRRIGAGVQFWNFETVHTIKFLTRYKEKFWHRVLHVVHTEDLVKDGHLTPLTYHKYAMIPQTRLAFNKSRSDFDLEDFDEQFNPFIKKTAKLIQEIDSESVLVFCATIKQAEKLQAVVDSSMILTGKTNKKVRAATISAFRLGVIRVVINVGVLLTGFDKPDLGAIVVARPTRSLRLHTQMLGRGMRVAEGKKTCHIYDLVGNVKHLGEVETLKITKIENKWNIITNTKPEGWHYAEVFTHRLHIAKDDDETQ